MLNYCIIHDKEMMSICCGCGPVEGADQFCGHCRDHAEFECWECVDEQEEAAKYWLDGVNNMTESEEILKEESKCESAPLT